mgnify:CR=1 FL=1
MNDIVVIGPVDAEAELDRIAARYRAAGGIGLKILNAVGGQAEGLLDKLPDEVRGGLDRATSRALVVALNAAETTRGRVPDQPAWVNTALTTAMGAVGGFGGLPSALVELPATTTMLLRAIQGAAAENGFDPASESVRFDCLRVFAVAGPLEQDDGSDVAFITLRLTLSGGAMHKMIALVAPKLAAVLGQKLAAQTVPVLGAVAGATTNYIYSSYYQEMAHVHFGLRRLAIDADISGEELTRGLRARLT